MAGNGSLNNPFEIYNINDFAKVGTGEDNWNMDSHYILMNDIDASETATWDYDLEYDKYWGFKYIGGNNYTSEFTGSFNGNYKNISNLYTNILDDEWIWYHFGVFCFVGPSGHIYNLTLDNYYLELKYQWNCGGFIGVNKGTVENIRIINSNIVLNDCGDVGGFVGQTLEESFIKNCGFEGLVKVNYVEPNFSWQTSSSSFFGFVWEPRSGSIENCFAKFEFNVENEVKIFEITGFLGHVWRWYGFPLNIIKNCYSQFKITGMGEYTNFIGGFGLYLTIDPDYNEIRDCYSVIEDIDGIIPSLNYSTIYPFSLNNSDWVGYRTGAFYDKTTIENINLKHPGTVVSYSENAGINMNAEYVGHGLTTEELKTRTTFLNPEVALARGYAERTSSTGNVLRWRDRENYQNDDYWPYNDQFADDWDPSITYIVINSVFIPVPLHSPISSTMLSVELLYKDVIPPNIIWSYQASTGIFNLIDVWDIENEENYDDNTWILLDGQYPMHGWEYSWPEEEDEDDEDESEIIIPTPEVDPTVYSYIYFPEMNYWFKKYWYNGEFKLPLETYINIPEIEESFFTKRNDSIFELLFNNNYSSQNVNYKFEYATKESLKPALLRRVGYLSKQPTIYLTSDEGMFDILNIGDESESMTYMMIEQLLSYRLTDTVDLEYIDRSELDTTLAILIYDYLNLMKNGIFSNFNISNPISEITYDNTRYILNYLFELYICNEANKLIQEWEQMIEGDLIELRQVRKVIDVDDDIVNNNYIIIEEELPYDTDDLFIYINGNIISKSKYNIITNSENITIEFIDLILKKYDKIILSYKVSNIIESGE